MRKAIVCVSGGLDSLLCIKLIQNLGIEPIVLHFTSPFYQGEQAENNKLLDRRITQQMGIQYLSIELGQAHLDIVRNQKHGYGCNLNPCIDCRILQLKYAKITMLQNNASFIVTGEVLGQRPMSQYRKALQTVDAEADVKGLVLRPLCAKLLEPTIPEIKGWIDRNSLLNFQGRSRKPQMKLAETLNISDYPNPAGGCLLTDDVYSRRLKDLLDHDQYDLEHVKLLKLGRHFRITNDSKLIVGRDEKENTHLLKLTNTSDLVLEPISVPGPTGLGRGPFNEESLHLCAFILAQYISKADQIEIKTTYLSNERIIPVNKNDNKDISDFQI